MSNVIVIVVLVPSQTSGNGMYTYQYRTVST
jgi:hypothetical protein